jgi:putative sigma-54 modulation protein
MNANIRCRRIALSRELRAHIERRLYFSLERFTLRMTRIDVLIEDLNGPRGGLDKLCRIKIRLRPTGTVIAEYVHSNLYTAVACAAGSAAEAAARAVQRLRDRRPEPRTLQGVISERGPEDPLRRWTQKLHFKSTTRRSA